MGIKDFVNTKVNEVIADVAKLNIISDGLIHFKLVHNCQNRDNRLGFWGLTVPIHLVKDTFTRADDAITEAIHDKGTTGHSIVHVNLSSNTLISSCKFLITREVLVSPPTL